MPDDAKVGEAYIELKAESATLMADMGKLGGEIEKALKPAQQKFADLGESMTKLGKSMSLKVTAPLAAVGTASFKAAVDFESAFAGVKKTVDATDEQFAALETGITEMARTLPASAEEIAGVAEAAGQLGIETDNILAFSKVMIDLGESTNLSADQAATALARLANITGMPQSEFDRLGSTIVDLGNNLATTEAEIVEMGLRLAGAGSQIGLTEAEILSFAGALSSVGIEAQAGGSAFSKVMVDMQLAVETGSEKLDQFAEVAGMTAEDFQKAFKEDAAGAILAFIDGLGHTEERGLSAIKVLDDMGIVEVRMRDALLRASGATDVFSGALEIGTKAWDENIALTKEAEQRYATTESQLAMTKNTLKEAARAIGQALIPVVTKLAEGLKKLADWFTNLSPGMQDFIVKVGLAAAAIGPLLLVGGQMSKGISGIIGLVGKLTPAMGGATKALTGLGGGFNVAGLAAKAGSLLLNPWVLGVAAAAAGGVALANYLKQDTIPAVQLFTDEVSESTQKAVGNFLNMEEDATLALKQLAWSGQTVTDEMAAAITGNISGMKDQVVAELETQKVEALASLSEMVASSTDLTEQEKEDIIRITGEKYDEQILKVEEGNRRIAEILNAAKKENRGITEAEKTEINAIKEEMKNDAIRILSESETEQLAILERLRLENGKITALQAAEVVKNSLKQKDESIAAAEEEYNERLKYAAQLRAEGGAEATALADKVAEEAKRQRDEAVGAAEEIHRKVVEEAKLQSGEHIKEIDWETGEVMTRWEKLKRWFKETPIKRTITTVEETIYVTKSPAGAGPRSAEQQIQYEASGTSFFSGGLAWVGERGPELIELPRGSKVYDHNESLRMVSSAVAGQSAVSFGDQTIIIELDGRVIAQSTVENMPRILRLKGAVI